MERSEVIEKVNKFLVEDLEIDPEIIKESASIKEDLRIDSLDFVDIVVIVEREFHFIIKPEDMGNIKTVSDFYDFLEKKANS